MNWVFKPKERKKETPHYCAPLVCILNVSGELASRRFYKKINKQKQIKRIHASPWFAFICQQVGLKVKLSFFRNECAHSACSGIQSTRHFIELVVVKTKQIVNSNSNVISMRQTCGQRSSMAAASKHRGLACYFSVRICYKFVISKCKGVWDLGLCITSAFAKRLPLRTADFRFFKRVWPQNSLEVSTAQRHSLCQCRSHAQA